MRLTCSALLLSLSVAGLATPVMAEAITYAGTLGKASVIVELVTPKAGGQPYGRYAYLSKGGDIPLHGAKAVGGGIALKEEKACTAKLCMGADNSPLDKAPLGGAWALTGAIGNETLEGSWRDPDSGKQLPIKLQRKGARDFEETPDMPFDALNAQFNNRGEEGDPPVISPQKLPYDFLKMAVPMQQGKEQPFGDGTVRMDTDKRVKMDYPVVVNLGSADTAADTGPVNAYLAQQRLQAELAAFSCMSSAYLGFGWSGDYFERSDGFDGNWSIQMEHLSPRLIGFQESGSYFCGGAHPSNFGDHRLADVKTGKPLASEDLLAGWVSRNADGEIVDPKTAPDPDALRRGPSDELIEHVKANRQKFDSETETDCGYDELIGDYLGVYFRQDSLVFTLNGLPHVIFACTDDMLEVPLKDARPLLTETGARYFAVLD